MLLERQGIDHDDLARYRNFRRATLAGASSPFYQAADQWDALASELGSHYRRCPRWAIFVQGVGQGLGLCRTQHDPTAPGTPRAYHHPV
jgi:hypothetical protein